MDDRLILLDPRDNVCVTRARIAAGAAIALEHGEARLDRALPIGHKIARRAIAAGEKVVKYGAPIGSATRPIAPGAAVHVHNLKSDYTPTYHLIGKETP